MRLDSIVRFYIIILTLLMLLSIALGLKIILKTVNIGLALTPITILSLLANNRRSYLVPLVLLIVVWVYTITITGWRP